jgi:DNA-binding Xre family transcriptional regulator
LDNSDLEFQTTLRRLTGLEKHAVEACEQLSRLYDLRARAAAQAGAVTPREVNEESKRRWSIVTDIDDATKRFNSDLEPVLREEIKDVFGQLLPEVPRRIAGPLAQLEERIGPPKLQSIRLVLGNGIRHLKGYVELPWGQECTAINDILLCLSQRLNGVEKQLDATDQHDAEAAQEAAQRSMAEWIRYEQAQKAKNVPRFITSRGENETVSQFIDRACAERSWKIPDLACRAGVNESQVYRLKKEEGVTSTTLRPVANVLGCSVDDLLPAL